MTAIIFIIVLAVLIFVHELGHFLVARWCGIRVDAFAIGFGPKVFGWKRDGVEYSLRLIPFGGYVKIFGENPDEENTKGPDAHRSFVNKKKIVQVAVLVAGVTFNFIFAWLLYIGIFTTGVTASSDTFEKYSDNITDKRVMITAVTDGSPADLAGLKVGDSLVMVEKLNESSMLREGTNEQVGSQEMGLIQLFQSNINTSAGKSISVTYSRGNMDSTINIIPVQGLVEDKYAIGIAMNEVGNLKLPFFTAVWEAARYTVITIKDIAVGLSTFIATIFQGTAKMSDVTGPVGIAGIVGDAASMGFVYLLMITAYISLNLGVINLLPFPALDGGRVLFVIIEAIIRRPIPMKWANIVNTIGFVLLMGLMVVVTFKDIVRIFK